MRTRAGADDRLAGLSTLEEDRGRDREHVVARGRLDVLVDVELGELDASAVLLLELAQDRLDRVTRAAPGRPEVHDHRRLRLDDLLLEARVGELVHRVML